MLSAFIHEASTHAAKCGVCIELQDVNKNYGAGIIQKWKCPKCGSMLEFRNCKWVKTGVVEEGRRAARVQPEINVRMVKAARINGVSLTKLNGTLAGGLGVSMPTRNNLCHTDKKIRGAVDTLFKTRREENLAGHVAASRAQGNEPIEFEYNGIKSKATPGKVSQDGGGKKRAFRHNINGDEAGVIVCSEITGKPLNLAHHQVSNTSTVY